MSETITITCDEGEFSGYLALPDGGKGPGLVLSQEIFGVNHVMKEIADNFAKEGYVVLVPDLFWRMEPGIDLGYDEAGWKKAFECYQNFQADPGIRDMQSAITTLRGHKACTGKVGVVGYCLGGLVAYLTACRSDCDAAVCYYGVGIEGHLGEAKNISCPTVLHFGGKDEFVPVEAIEKIKKTLKAFENIDVFFYSDNGHAFARVGEAAYDKTAADLAQKRTLKLLKSAIG